MLQQQLPLLDSDAAAFPRWLAPAVAGAAGLSAAALLWIGGANVAALVVLSFTVLGTATLAVRKASSAPSVDLSGVAAAPDFSIIGSILALTGDAAAVTSSEGTLLAANPAYRDLF